jgi:hypothetical protein
MIKLFFAFFLILTGCLKENNLTPESALQSFVESRMGNIVSRDFVLERVGGKLRQSLENISDEEFSKFADLRNVNRNSFKILTKSCQEKQCFITYSISYNTINEGKATFTTEVKKIAELQNDSGRWLINDVTNVKTYHEALEPINP